MITVAPLVLLFLSFGLTAAALYGVAAALDIRVKRGSLSKWEAVQVFIPFASLAYFFVRWIVGVLAGI